MSGLAALLWIKLPGGSDGICGGETAYLFSPTQARRLTMNSPFVPADGRRLRGRRRFGNRGRTRPTLIGVAACRPTWTNRRAARR
jgi:hypothetical protein